MNDLPEWFAGLLIVGGILIVMSVLIAAGARVARWALLREKRSEGSTYEKRSGD